MMKNRYLEAGKIVTTHGLRGELKVFPWADSASDLCGIKRFYLDDGGRKTLDVETSREHKNMALIKFKGYDEIDQARKLIDRTLYLDRGDLNTEDDDYFVVDLIGLRVVDADDDKVLYGEVIDVISTGAHDIYTVKLQNGKTGMIPAVSEMIESIDLESGVIKARPAKGLLDDED